MPQTMSSPSSETAASSLLVLGVLSAWPGMNILCWNRVWHPFAGPSLGSLWGESLVARSLSEGGGLQGPAPPYGSRTIQGENPQLLAILSPFFLFPLCFKFSFFSSLLYGGKSPSLGQHDLGEAASDCVRIVR